MTYLWLSIKGRAVRNTIFCQCCNSGCIQREILRLLVSDDDPHNFPIRISEYRSDDTRRSLEEVTKEREAVDKEWEDVQLPVRACIASLADEAVADGWDDGDRVAGLPMPVRGVCDGEGRGKPNIDRPGDEFERAS